MSTRSSQIEEKGLMAYPHMFHSNSDFNFVEFQKYQTLENGQKNKDVFFRGVGRILLKREASKKLYFYKLLVDGNDVQICSNLGDYQKEKIVGYHEVIENGGEVETIDLVEGFSTSNILKKILK